MLGVMIRKMWHKKWLFFCLLLGSILLIATAASYPMYRNAVYDRMLQDEFDEYLQTNSKWPAMLEMVTMSEKESGGKTMTKLEDFTEALPGLLGVRSKERVVYYALLSSGADSEHEREDRDAKDMRLSYLSGLPEHARIIAGEMYSEDGVDEEGYIEVIISEATMLNLGLYVGDCYQFEWLVYADGTPVRVRIVGVFCEEDASDFYWQVKPDEVKSGLFMNEDLFRAFFMGENAGRYSLTCKYYVLFEYQDIHAAHVSELLDTTEYLTEESEYRSMISKVVYPEVLTSYMSKETRISTTLFILQVPVMLLLCAFLFMISCQMYETERNDISVMKSRGASRGQIFRLYLYQSILLTGLGILGGLPLGSIFCRILGSADHFLEFGIRRNLEISYSADVYTYAFASAVVCVLIMTIPALKHSKVSIVHLKQQKALKKRAWWEVCFLDLIFIGISLYGYYNYSKHTDSLLQSALKGEALDPLLYVSSSLFILGMGMLFLRIQPWIVNGIYLIGKNRWKPAMYASFREIVKNGRRQQYIMLFMILTVSLGMFNAVSARTIQQNTLNNTEYLKGADIVMQEVWEDNSMLTRMDPSIEFQYYEPDYGRFEMLEGAEHYTKVYVDERGYISGSANKQSTVTIMGIHTKEFGQVTMVEDALLEQPYYQYLNDLAVSANGILVSANFHDVLGYREGDYVSFSNGQGESAGGVIVGFFDYWPTYEPKSVILDKDNEIKENDNYMIVAHLSNLQQFWGLKPYQVWIDMNDGKGTDAFYRWVKEYKVPLKMYVDRTVEMQKVIEDPLLQGMNGVLTMSFIVMILLCAAGYLIYWIMSIRSRELMFGALRAFGMHKEEVLHMLINEQLFSGGYAVLAGIGIGTVAYRLYVPILQTAYATTNQVLPLTLITQKSDMIRLYGVVGVTMVVCLIVLAVIVWKLNITKALKLGEE